MAARGRYAPSPTGRLHVGNARTALLAWLSCRVRGGAFVLRIEDLDRARVLPDAEAELLADLRWLGLDWDEGPDVTGGPFAPYRQSERGARYDAAIEQLLSVGRAFPCACSRAEVARAASAPHGAEDEGPRYPGTCRALGREEVEARARAADRPLTIRFAGAGERISFVDGVHGDVEPLGPAGVDDFVLRRADGVAAYQLAVVVDDAAMAIDEVVRGDDLLSSTPRQIALHRALGLRVPTFAHVPLLLDASGERLAKRTRPPSLASLREGGRTAAEVVGRLASSARLGVSGQRLTAAELLASLEGIDPWSRLDRRPAVWTP
ncbi:MAG TPA: tRNA glutamyl-Q(34) synthetase GluQRS [Polyangia bacterium]